MSGTYNYYSVQFESNILEEAKRYLNSISTIGEEAYTAFFKTLELRDFKKGAYFAKEGRYENHFGILTKGVARAFFRNVEGVEYNKFFNVPISFIGAYSSLVTKTKNLINIQCLTSCQILVGEYDNFCNLYKEYPEIETLSRRLSEFYFVSKEKREIELVLLDGERRYAIFKEEYPNLEQFIPQYHIASYLGITATQLSRIRRSLTQK